MNQSTSPKARILFFSIVIFINGVIIGVLLCRNNHKEQPSVVYDINDIADSINAANAKIDTNITKQEIIIKYEKGKIIERYFDVDSLSYDSLFKLWTESAQQYKPLIN